MKFFAACGKCGTFFYDQGTYLSHCKTCDGNRKQKVSEPLPESSKEPTEEPKNTVNSQVVEPPTETKSESTSKQETPLPEPPKEPAEFSSEKQTKPTLPPPTKKIGKSNE